jgi:membrane-associated protease RseP (regulator of RpoE activity)
MKMKRIALGLLILSGFSSPTTFAQDDIPVIPGQPQKITIIQNEAGEQFRNIQLFQPSVLEENTNAGAYYLGLDCEAIPPLYRKQLKLGPDSGGLLITDVMKDSPAGKAKLKEGDIILKINGQDIKSIKALVEKVQANQDQSMSISIRRDGEDQTIEAKPEKRPTPATAAIIGNKNPTPQDAHAKWMEQLRKQGFDIQMPATGTFDVIRPAPGIVLGSATAMAIALPDNTSVTIKHEGKKPAQIEVKQGDKTYSVTSDKLADLPADVRKLVEPMLSGTGQAMFSAQTGGAMLPQPQIIQIPAPGQPGMPPQMPQIRIQQLPNMPTIPVPMAPNMEKQMNELREQMQEMQKQLQQLQK